MATAVLSRAAASGTRLARHQIAVIAVARCRQIRSSYDTVSATHNSSDHLNSILAPASSLAPRARHKSHLQIVSPFNAPLIRRPAAPGPQTSSISSTTSSHQSFELASEEDVAIEADTSMLFDKCFRKLSERLGESLRVPREIVWLNGAPGSGKGVNTPFIMRYRGLERCVGVSSLLETNPMCKALMDEGSLIDDELVGDLLLDAIFDPTATGAGLIIDGFPRTSVQVDFLKLLHDKLLTLHNLHGAEDPLRFPRPAFRLVLLHVSEIESVKRQLGRAEEVAKRNSKVHDMMVGNLEVERSTDTSREKAHWRYFTFKKHYPTLLRLKQFFPFTLIDASGTLAQCEEQIAKELRYQSSLELSAETWQAIRHIPLSQEVVRDSRQQLVARLDCFAKNHTEQFDAVVRCIETEVTPLLNRCSMAGHAMYATKDALFNEHPIAIDVLIDILSDRGYFVSYRRNDWPIPTRFDLKTGEIHNEPHGGHEFRIEFEVPNIRKRAKRDEYVPEH